MYLLLQLLVEMTEVKTSVALVNSTYTYGKGFRNSPTNLTVVFNTWRFWSFIILLLFFLRLKINKRKFLLYVLFIIDAFIPNNISTI